MSTIKNFNVRKGLPYQINARAAGEWDNISSHTFNQSEETASVTMTAYNGLDMSYSASYESADTLDFSNTVLPWKFDYSESLDVSKFCLMPVKHQYSNITETSGSTPISLTGCTYNYVDDGSAVTLNCFTENFDDAVVLTPNVSYASHEMVNPLNGSIYKSMVYTSIATTDDWEDTDNVIDWYLEDEVDNMIIGSPTVSTNTISGFSTSDYLMQTGSFNPGNHWWEISGTLGVTSIGVQQIFAHSDGFVLGVDENNHFFAKLYDADGEIGTITITDYTAATGTWMDTTIRFQEINGQYEYMLFAKTAPSGDISYAELQSNRTILPGPITFGCGYNPIPQRLLGTVSIPAHTVYEYKNGTWTGDSQGGSEGGSEGIEVPEFE